MLERTTSRQSFATRLAAYRAVAAPRFARAWRVTARAAAEFWALAKLVVCRTWRLTKHATNAILNVVEKTLLSASGRERVHATAVFALIFAFGVTSVDYLLTGGPELSQGARAAPYAAQASLISARSPRPAADLAFAAPMDTTIEDGVIEEATITPLSARAPALQPMLGLADAENPKAEPAPSETGGADRTKAKD
jgi:hypothetical protein